MLLSNGRMLNSGEQRLIRLMGECGFVVWRDNPFRLKSGIESHVYVMGREDLTDHPRFVAELGKHIAKKARGIAGEDPRQICLIGLPMAGIPLAQAASMEDFVAQREPDDDCNVICFRLMRTEVKTHGAHAGQWVTGMPDHERHLYITVDNVITDGNTKEEGAERLDGNGYRGKKIDHIIVMDRGQGGMERLKRMGYKVHALLNLEETAEALVLMRLWPPDRLEAVRQEIQAHQFS